MNTKTLGNKQNGAKTGKYLKRRTDQDVSTKGKWHSLCPCSSIKNVTCFY